MRSVLIQPGLIQTEIMKKGRSSAAGLDVYRVRRERALRRLRRQIAQGSDPALVANVIYRAVTCSNPRQRYRVGKGALLLWVLRKCGPDAFVNRAVERIIR